MHGPGLCAAADVIIDLKYSNWVLGRSSSNAALMISNALLWALMRTYVDSYLYDG